MLALFDVQRHDGRGRDYGVKELLYLTEWPVHVDVLDRCVRLNRVSPNASRIRDSFQERYKVYPLRNAWDSRIYPMFAPLWIGRCRFVY
jgi:hypothetical protein